MGDGYLVYAMEVLGFIMLNGRITSDNKICQEMLEFCGFDLQTSLRGI